MAVHHKPKRPMSVHPDGAVLGTQRRSTEKITLDPTRLIGFTNRNVSVGATRRGTEKIGLGKRSPEKEPDIAIGTSKMGPEKSD